MHIYHVTFETPRGVEPYRDMAFKIVVPDPPSAGGLHEAIAACPPPPEGLVLDSISYTGPVHNADDWQHV